MKRLLGDPLGALLLSVDHMILVDREVENVRGGCQARGRDLARRATRLFKDHVSYLFDHVLTFHP